MKFKILDKSHQQEVVALVTEAFSSSEGEKEGEIVGQLASKLSSNMSNETIICIGAYENALMVGAIFFTRLSLKAPLSVYMLSPVAVSTQHQRMGVGQALINYGLNELKNRSVSVAITYGDPAFYAKVGFQSLSEQVIKAPLKLSMPEGWLGQSLTDQPIPTVDERPICVEAFNDPSLW